MSGAGGDNQNGVCAGGEAGWPWAQSSGIQVQFVIPGDAVSAGIYTDLLEQAGRVPEGGQCGDALEERGHLIGLGGALRKGNQQAEIWERGRQFLFCGT